MKITSEMKYTVITTTIGDTCPVTCHFKTKSESMKYAAKYIDLGFRVQIMKYSVYCTNPKDCK